MKEQILAKDQPKTTGNHFIAFPFCYIISHFRSHDITKDVALLIFSIIFFITNYINKDTQPPYEFTEIRSIQLNPKQAWNLG